MQSSMLLTSKANPRFKSLRERLAVGGARREGTLLLGGKLIEAWAEVRESPAGARFRPDLWLRLEGAPAHPLQRELDLPEWEIGEALMRELADAGSAPLHALVAALGPEPSGSLSGRVIAPWGIQDPGNLGAILRSAAAFGFGEALLGPGCADPFAPRALRGSMGAAFLLPIRRVETLVLDHGRWYALDAVSGADLLSQADLRPPLRILVGNEGHGFREAELPEGIRRLAIPVAGVESLNAAVAAGIACYEATRRG